MDVKSTSYELRVFFRSVGGRSDATLWSVDDSFTNSLTLSIERRGAEARSSFFFLSLLRDWETL